MTVFETERLLVRRFTLADKEHFFWLNGDATVMRYIRPVKSRAESDAQLEDLVRVPASAVNGRWAVVEKATGMFIGSFAIIPILAEPEKTQLGYSFIPAAWGKGYASELARAGLHYFLEQTTVPEIYGVTETPNIASRKVLEKAGFRYLETKMEEGKELQVFIVRR